MTHSGAVRVLFRAAGGRGIGLGHVTRCSALAQALVARGAEVRMFVRGDERAAALAGEKGIEAAVLPEAAAGELPTRLLHAWTPHVLVVDDYDVPSAVVAASRDRAPTVVHAVLDDLGGRYVPADVLINGTPGAESFEYTTEAGCLRLLGARFILLQPGFAAVPAREHREAIERVLITTGGADIGCLAARALHVVRRALGPVEAVVVRGPFADAASEAALAAVWDEHLVRVEHSNDLRAAMLACDLAVSAAGQSLYELAATATPSVAVIVAANQRANVRALEREGTLVSAGEVDEAEVEDRIATLVARLASDLQLRRAMGDAGRRAIDGRGAARVANALLERVAEWQRRETA